MAMKKLKIKRELLLAISVLGLILLCGIRCQKDVAIPQSSGNNTSNSSTPPINLISNGSFENGLNGWFILPYPCDSPYIYVKNYNTPRGGGNKIAVLVNGTTQGLCWAYYPSLSYTITGINGNKLHLSFWAQRTCVKILAGSGSCTVLDSNEISTNNPYCTTLDNYFVSHLKVGIFKSSNAIFSFEYYIPHYKWKKYDTLISFPYNSLDTIKLIFSPSVYTWNEKCYLLDLVELKQ